MSSDQGLISPAEQKAGHHIAQAVVALDSYLQEFHYALKLFDAIDAEMAKLAPASALRSMPQAEQTAWGDKMMTYLRWKQIAARDAAMTIYHIGRAISAIRTKNLPLCPTLGALTDHAALREADRRFERAFPHYELIRHAIGHAAEIMATPAKTAENALSGTYSDPGGITATGEDFGLVSLDGRRYSVTIRKQVMSYSLSKASLAELAACIAAVRAALPPVIEHAVQEGDQIKATVDQQVTNVTGDEG